MPVDTIYWYEARNAQEHIRGLCLLEEQETRLTALRAALDEGERSGAPSAFDVDAFLTEKTARRG